MSTRGWYEYYVLEEKTKEISLAMQFYKWGDAVPENAIWEWQALEELLQKFNRKLPVHWLDEMLRDNLEATYQYLPKFFSLGCYFFLLHRALDETFPLKYLSYRNVPKEQTPHYKLGYAVGLSEVKNESCIKKYNNNLIDTAHFFVQVGRLVRRWQPFSLKWTFLKWIQYITQIEDKLDMGAIAGDYRNPGDTSYIFRFFLYVPERNFEADQTIDKICLDPGIRLSSDKNYEEWELEQLSNVQSMIKKHSIPIFSLDEALQTYQMIPSQLFDK